MRKSKSSENEPVKVAYANNLTEAEFIQSLLSDEQIPSMLRRAPGFDVPDFLAAGPRLVLVPPAAVQKATEILAELEKQQDSLPGS